MRASAGAHTAANSYMLLCLQQTPRPRLMSDATQVGAKPEPMVNYDDRIIHTRVLARHIKDVDTLFEHVKVCAFLGKGGFGMVFEVSFPLLLPGAQFALKVIPRNEYSSSGQVLEYKLLESLNHPNILVPFCSVNGPVPKRLLPVLQQQDRGMFKVKRRKKSGKQKAPMCQYIVTELVSPLRKELRDDEDETDEEDEADEELTFPVFLNYACELLSAVSYLQEKRITHRDLKLDNLGIVERSQGHPKIVVLDFGCAINLEKDLTTMLSFPYSKVGNPSHQPAEVLNALCARSNVVVNYSLCDSFAAGVLLLEMATTEHPLETDDADYPDSCRVDLERVEYKLEDITIDLPEDYPSEIADVIRGLVHPDIKQRLNATVALCRLRKVIMLCAVLRRVNCLT